MTWNTSDIPDQTGRTAVITGGNGGLGLASAAALAAKGAHVVIAARNRAKAEDAREQILGETPDAVIEIVDLDLASLASVDRAADEIVERHGAIDLLMCNAGVMAIPKSTTDDGFDTQFGVNVLGHWALVGRLMPLILATPNSRIVTLSSTAQHTGRAIDPSDPHMVDGYEPWRMYGQTKLAMRHFAVGLQERFDAAGLDIRALTAQPGLTNSDLQATTVEEGGGGVLGTVSEKLVRLIGMSPGYGALSQLRAATDPAAAGGGYYGPAFGTNGPPIRKPLIRPGSDEAIGTLWDVAERETGVSIDIDIAAAVR